VRSKGADGTNGNLSDDFSYIRPFQKRPMSLYRRSGCDKHTIYRNGFAIYTVKKRHVALKFDAQTTTIATTTPSCNDISAAIKYSLLSAIRVTRGRGLNAVIKLP